MAKDDSSQPAEANGAVLSFAATVSAAPGVPLLRDVRIHLRAGRIVGVSGPSGCGKTTLLRGICGLVDADGAEVRLHGQTPDEHGWPVFRRKVVLLNQRPVLSEATVRENLARPFCYATAAGAFDENEAADLLDRLTVGRRRLDQDAHSLSVGQQQRVCLIRALLVRPDVLLMDEPTSALDADAVGAVEREIRRRAADGLACLLVSHDRAQVDRWCDRWIDLRPHMTEHARAAGEEGA